MIRIVDYKVDNETQRMLLTQAILELVRDTIGIRWVTNQPLLQVGNRSFECELLDVFTQLLNKVYVIF